MMVLALKLLMGGMFGACVLVLIAGVCGGRCKWRSARKRGKL